MNAHKYSRVAIVLGCVIATVTAGFAVPVQAVEKKDLVVDANSKKNYQVSYPHLVRLTRGEGRLVVNGGGPVPEGYSAKISTERYPVSTQDDGKGVTVKVNPQTGYLDIKVSSSAVLGRHDFDIDVYNGPYVVSTLGQKITVEVMSADGSGKELAHSNQSQNKAESKKHESTSRPNGSDSEKGSRSVVSKGTEGVKDQVKTEDHVKVEAPAQKVEPEKKDVTEVPASAEQANVSTPEVTKVTKTENKKNLPSWLLPVVGVVAGLIALVAGFFAGGPLRALLGLSR